MQQSWGDIEMPEVLVVQLERLHMAEGRRLGARVDDNVVDGTVRATYELGLASSRASVESAQDTRAGARLGVLNEARRTDAVCGRNLSVERSGEEAPVVVVWGGHEDQYAWERCCVDVHPAIVAPLR